MPSNKTAESTAINRQLIELRKRFGTSLYVFFMLSVTLSALAIVYLLYETRQMKISILDDLTAIADLKATQIANWKNERYEDAKQLYETPMLQQMASAYLQHGDSEHSKVLLTQWMNLYYKQNDYSWIALLNPQGQPVLSIPSGNSAPKEDHFVYVKAAMDSLKIICSDLHKDKNSAKVSGEGIYYSFWVPVLNPSNPQSKALGVWLLQIDPTITLYPIINSWQGSSKTAETLLVRRDGNDVLFLNELRHREDTALKLRYNIESNPQLPAARAVQGLSGVMEGIDYRGVKVVSSICGVYGTPWKIVAKIDKSELYLPLRRRIHLVSFIGLVMIILLAMAIREMQRRRDADWLKQQLVLEQEKALLQEEQRKIALEWQSTFDSISDAIWLLDKDNKIIRANKATYSYLTHPDTEIIGNHCWNAVHNLEAPFKDCPYARMANTKQRAISEVRNGDRWLMITIDPILDENKELIGSVHIMRDITSRKLSDEALRESEYTFRELFEHMSSGVTFYEPIDDGKDFRITSINSAGERITKRKREEIIGFRIREVFPGVEEMGLISVLEKVNATGLPIQYETHYYHDKVLSAYYDNYVLKLETGYIVAIYDDATQRMEAEIALSSLNEELEQRVEERTAQLALANQELEAFSFSVSHDLRSPLRGISGWSQALLDEYEACLDEQGKEYLNRVISETQRMASLIEGLLKLAQISRAELSPLDVDLSALAEEVRDRLLEQATHPQVEFEIQPNLRALGDKDLLEVALTNLFGNALKFSMKRERPKIEFGKIPNQEKTVYYVRDNGAGFDMEHASKLFGAFQRLHKASEYPGTGVGLATVQRIINRHGGRIWAESQSDAGATFFFTLQEQS